MPRSMMTWAMRGDGRPCPPCRARSSRTASSRRGWRSPSLSHASSWARLQF